MLGKMLPWVVVGIVAAAFLAVFHYFAPLEPASVAVYAGLVVWLAGVVSMIKPLRFLGVRTRRKGMLVAAGGLALAVVALMWPAGVTRVRARSSRLDAIMPEYHFSERHVVRVRAQADRTMQAMKDVTFEEIGIFVPLMRIRAMVLGKSYRPGPVMRQPVMKAFANPRSGFVSLSQDEREIVMGMAGRPWTGQPGPVFQSAEQYAAYNEPNAVKIAFNIRVENEGPRWSRLETETRIRATDDSSRRTMARYWRLIYPGSGMIRRIWLNAARARAERYRSASQARNSPSGGTSSQ